MKLELLTSDVPHLFPFLETVLQDGGAKAYEIQKASNTVFNNFGYSGYEYEDVQDTKTSLSFGMILGGTGYVLKRVLGDSERYDYFSTEGVHNFTTSNECLKVVIVDFYEMDTSCPILNHFYNFLSAEYKQASEARSNTKMVHSAELFLRGLYKNKNIRLPIQEGANDPAITNIYNKILKAEMDPVLKWEERQLVFSKYKEDLNCIVATKCRAHKKSQTALKMALLKKDWGNFLARFLARPNSNAMGLLYRYTIGKVLWFFATVKDNLGYSIALAVYGPFTYYFITMPMNPHAMQAVGRVRSTYLDVRSGVGSLMHRDQAKATTITPLPAASGPARQEQTSADSVTTVNAAPIKEIDPNSYVIFPSAVTTAKRAPLMIQMGNGFEKGTPSFLNMLLTTDMKKVDEQSWSERMSNFKQMQIGYEENIEFASRMGRLEQLETQYNFPMQVESTWEELERYNNLIFKMREENPNLSAKMKQYLFNEINRTQQLQLYLWDRLARFILDQPYVMLDQDKEQKRNDYYVGRSFVFMQEMTNVLSWRYKDFKKPQGFEKIEKLADFYKSARKEHGTVLKNLAANSDLYKQKDIYSTSEFRSYMKRQWEILYLQNSKVEEASNMGLNMYIWSVRNSVWVLQSIYAAKRDELSILVKRDVTGNLLTPAELNLRSRSAMLYETLLHNLTLEYVGIRDEIMNRLGKDVESAQRMTVIENLQEFLVDRDKLDGIIVNNKKTADTNL